MIVPRKYFLLLLECLFYALAHGLFIGFLISELTRANLIIGRFSKCPQFKQYHWHFPPKFSLLNVGNGFDYINDDIFPI